MPRTMSLWALGLVIWAGCTRDPQPTREQKKPRVTVVVLASGQETTPTRLLEAWRSKEGHCDDGGCATLAVSTGGAVPLPAGYAAATLQQDFDGGVPQLSCNRPGATPSVPVTRLGVDLQVLGLNNPVDGGTATPVEEALVAIQMPYFMLGPKGTVLVSDVCVDELESIIRRRGISWPFLLLAVGRRCGASPAPRNVYSTLVVSSGEGDGQYSRSALTFDKNTGALLKAQSELVELSAPQ